MEDNETDLEELKKIELDILKNFIEVCNKLNLNYYLIGGTLIGAIRHKGFIPWDDDIDVCMLRKDYNFFLKNGQKYLKDNYFLQTYETDNGYPGCFAKIRNNNTTFLETSIKNYNMNHGIFIDVFPLDNSYKYNKIKQKLIYYKLYNEKFLKDKNIIKRIVANISKIIYKNKSKIELCRKEEAIYIKKNKKKTQFVTNYCGSWGAKRETHSIDDFKDYLIADFENLKVKIPCGYDNILKNTYGDYMKLPPKEKRVTHHYTDIIDTNKSYKEYVNFGG